MQRHGGSRPAGEPAAKAATKAARENADERNRSDADAGTAPEKTNEAKK
jgi:hypothetical protein